MSAPTVAVWYWDPHFQDGAWILVAPNKLDMAVVKLASDVGWFVTKVIVGGTEIHRSEHGCSADAKSEARTALCRAIELRGGEWEPAK